MLSKPHLSISDGLRCLAFQQSATSSWQRSSAQDLHLLWSLSEHILQNWCLSLLQSYNATASSWHILVIAEVNYFMRFVVASRWSWWGVLDVVQHCSAISSSNDSSFRPLRCAVCFLVSCTGAAVHSWAHHWMISWEASAGCFTMGVSTSSCGDINVKESTALKHGENYQSWNILKPTQVVVICWEMGFDAWWRWNSCLNLSDIQSALRFFPWMPNSHLVDHENWWKLPVAGTEKPTEEHNIFASKTV